MRRTVWALPHQFLLLVMSVVICGCIAEIPSVETGVNEKNEDVLLKFDLIPRHSVKSSISPDEMRIVDVNLFAFSEGRLVAEGYFAADDVLELKLLFGHTYNLYALANVGHINAPLEEDVFKQECICAVEAVSDMSDAIPMAWEQNEFQLDSYYDRVCLDFERQVAKVLLSVDETLIGDIEINSVRLCQSPIAVWPFRYQEGSHVSDLAYIKDGDYATTDDLAVLNEGGQIGFYVMENCQGQLLSGNEDPRKKVPDMIGERSSFCTYLQVGCSFKEGGFYQGDMMYRLYLGQDACSDFNIKANSVINVSLCLTDDGLNEVSWRVEADVDVNEGYAVGWVSLGLHNITDLYVGERFVYTLMLAEEMMQHLNEDVSSARLCVSDNETDGLLQFSDFKYVDLYEGWNVYEVEVLCTGHGRGVLCLEDAEGRVVAVLNDVLVQKPQLLVSDMESCPYGEVIPDSLCEIVTGINGEERLLYFYLADSQRRNLNLTSAYDFELSLFDFCMSGTDIEEEMAGAFEIVCQDGISGSDGPFQTISISCVNSGTSSSMNMALCDFMEREDTGIFIFEETNYGMTEDVAVRVDYPPITLTLVDNGWAGYHDCQISMKVDNISKLPLDVKCWQFNTGNDDYNALTRNEAVEQYGVKYTREAYNCISGYSALGAEPIYASFDSFTTKPNNELSVYPLPELSTNSIYMVLAYDYCGQEALSHHVDVAFSDGSSVDNVSVVDNLSDGSTTYEIVYGNDPDADGWNDRGAWLYSCGQLLQKAGTEFDAYPTLDTYDLERLHNGTSGKIYVNYDSTEKSFTAYVSTAALNGLTITAEYVIKAQGYVQTTPNGTWGKKVDNYCHTVVTKAIENHVLTTTPVIIDDGGLQEAMNTIYASTYIDSYNKVGSSNSYQHSAHPTSIDVEIELSLSGNFQGSVIPVVFTKPSQTTFYHAQEDVTYNVPITSSLPLHKIAIVDNL